MKILTLQRIVDEPKEAIGALYYCEQKICDTLEGEYRLPRSTYALSIAREPRTRRKLLRLNSAAADAYLTSGNVASDAAGGSIIVGFLSTFGIMLSSRITCQRLAADFRDDIERKDGLILRIL